MNKELLVEAQAIWEKDEKIGKFGSRFDVYPQKQARKLHEDMNRLAEQVHPNPNPTSTDELHEAELKRSLASRLITLEHFLTGQPMTLDNIIAMYGLETADLDSIQPWLMANKRKTQGAIERLFSRTDVQSYEMDLSLDIPRIRQQAEGYAGAQITNYHQKLGSLFEGLTAAGSYLHRITSEPSTEDRSYFNTKTRRLALSMDAICYEVEDGTIQLRERELLRLFGHEGMGHALQNVITATATDIPFFLRESSTATIATEESVTQHFEQVIFEDVKGSPKTQRDLRIGDRFGEIYQEEIDTRQINAYNRNFFRYSILVLADKSHGDPQDPEVMRKKVELLSKVELNPGQGFNVVDRNRFKYDSRGNFSPQLMSELRYSSQAVDRAVDVFTSHGYDYTKRDDRSHIDLTLLTGYYTPAGLVQKASLAANQSA